MHLSVGSQVWSRLKVKKIVVAKLNWNGCEETEKEKKKKWSAKQPSEKNRSWHWQDYFLPSLKSIGTFSLLQLRQDGELEENQTNCTEKSDEKWINQNWNLEKSKLNKTWQSSVVNVSSKSAKNGIRGLLILVSDFVKVETHLPLYWWFLGPIFRLK